VCSAWSNGIHSTHTLVQQRPPPLLELGKNPPCLAIHTRTHMYMHARALLEMIFVPAPPLPCAFALGRHGTEGLRVSQELKDACDGDLCRRPTHVMLSICSRLIQRVSFSNCRRRSPCGAFGAAVAVATRARAIETAMLAIQC
jgi:hypothetical protein